MLQQAIIAIALILITGGMAFSAPKSTLSGDAYLMEIRAKQAIPVGVEGPSQSSSGDYLDLHGTLSGSMGTSGQESALITSGNSFYTVRFNGATMPPSGSSVRLLVRQEENSRDLILMAWAFASDVDAALRKPADNKPNAAPPAPSLDDRKRGATVSRGGIGDRFDHTEFFRQYSSAIAQINPRLSAQEVERITQVLLNTSRECDVDPRWIMAMVIAESSFNPNATSPKGAMGLGQLMPATARSMGLRDPYDPAQNLDAAIKILRSALNQYSNNAAWKDLTWEHKRLALAAYNAGSGAVRRHGGVPPFRETQTYIERVKSYYEQLCGAN